MPAKSDEGGAEIGRQATLSPVTVEQVKPESHPAADNEGTDTVEQRDMVTAEQRVVVTEEQRGVVTAEQRGVVTAEQRGVVTEEQRGVVTEEQRGVVTEEQRGVVTEEQRGVVAEEQRGVVTEEKSGVVTEKQEKVVEEQRGVIHRKQSGVVGGARVSLVKVMEHIQSTLREKRRKCGRPEELHVSWQCTYMHMRTSCLPWSVPQLSSPHSPSGDELGAALGREEECTDGNPPV